MFSQIQWRRAHGNQLHLLAFCRFGHVCAALRVKCSLFGVQPHPRVNANKIMFLVFVFTVACCRSTGRPTITRASVALLPIQLVIGHFFFLIFIHLVADALLLLLMLMFFLFVCSFAIVDHFTILCMHDAHCSQSK